VNNPQPSDEHLHDPATGQHLTFLQTAADTGGELLRVHVRLDPGGRVPRHAHVRQDERVEVLAGTVSLAVGRHARSLMPGDTADVPRRRVHVLRNTGDGEARFVLEVRPARRMEGTMRAIFRLSRLARPLTRTKRTR